MKRRRWDDLRHDWQVLLFVAACYTLPLTALAAWWVFR